MNKIKKENGITLIALVTTIVLILILASIAVTGGSEIIKKANLENLKTNLLLVEAKAKEALEQAVHELGPSDASADRTEAARGKLEVIGSIPATQDDLNKVGLSDRQPEDNEGKVYFYSVEATTLKDSLGIDGLEGTIVIEYNLTEIKVEVYSSKGFVDNKQTKHSLTDIQEIEL